MSCEPARGQAPANFLISVVPNNGSNRAARSHRPSGVSTCGNPPRAAGGTHHFSPICRRVASRTRTTMTYQAPVSDIAFALKHAARFSAARDDGVYDLTDDLLHAV